MKCDKVVDLLKSSHIYYVDYNLLMKLVTDLQNDSGESRWATELGNLFHNLIVALQLKGWRSVGHQVLQPVQRCLVKNMLEKMQEGENPWLHIGSLVQSP